jgi:hypothetical protein
MANECSHCGQAVGFWNNVINRRQCSDCREGVEVAVEQWTSALHQCLEDRILTVEEEQQLVAYAAQLRLTRADLEPLRPRLERARVISAALVNQSPEVGCDLNLKDGECCLWTAPASLMEERVRREYHRGSRGTSIRIVKGVSFRIGATRGYSVPIHYMATVAYGRLYITTTRSMFVSPRKSVTVTHKELLSFEPFDDGLQLQTGRSTKLQVLKFDDGELAAAVLSGQLNAPTNGWSQRGARVPITQPGLTTWQSALPRRPLGWNKRAAGLIAMKTIAIVAMIMLPPVGVLFAWWRQLWSTRTRLAASVASLAFFAMVMSSHKASSKTVAPPPAPAPPTEVATPIPPPPTPLDDAQDFITACGKPTKDFTTMTNNHQIRHLVYAKASTELMFQAAPGSVWQLSSTHRVGLAPSLSVIELTKRLPCAGSVHHE